MAPDMTEMAKLLDGGKLVLILLMQGQIHPPRSDAVVGQVPEFRGVPGFDDEFFFHVLPPFPETFFQV
jgi:hypothetical protein